MKDDDIVTRLIDLRRQATEERSHNYVAKCVADAIAEIVELRMTVRRLKQSVDTLTRSCGEM